MERLTDGKRALSREQDLIEKRLRREDMQRERSEVEWRARERMAEAFAFPFILGFIVGCISIAGPATLMIFLRH